MLGQTDLVEQASRWLAALEGAVQSGGEAELGELFDDDSHWRDVLALTWEIQTFNGKALVREQLAKFSRRARPSDFRIDQARTAPRKVVRAGVEVVEVIFAFETGGRPCSGVVRLLPPSSDASYADDIRSGELPAKAWTLLTALEALDTKGAGGPSCSGANAANEMHPDKSFSRDFHGPNWLDHRVAAAAYEDRDPAVLVVGAGQAGLSIAAQLTTMGVDTLLVDRGQRIGDTWRNRYHALTLHNQKRVNHLPFMPFPPNWPTYIPKDKLAGWFEAYAESMELNVWTSTVFEGGAYDEGSRTWSVTLRRGDGSVRHMQPRHVVMATGASGIPSIPSLPGLETFSGTVVHSGAFGDSRTWAGKRAMVIGTGTSGHDIAQDLHSNGAQVTIVQRNPTMVANIEPSAQLPYRHYEEGPPLEDCDLLTVSLPLPVLRRIHQRLTAEGRQHDRDLLQRLERKGFQLDFGVDGTGWQFKYLTRGGGYYFNVGCSDLIADGKVDLLQYSAIGAFTSTGARLRDGGTVAADVIVLATGYKGLEHEVAQLFGEDVARRIGPIWGFGEEQELRNMFKRTAQPGLWFIAGAFAQCRIYSRYLALQITASEAGLLPPAN